MITGFLSNKNLSLATRIRRSAFVLMMVIIIVLGCLWLTLALMEIPANHRKTNQSEAHVVGEVLSSEISNHLDTLKQLGNSPLVWTALVDSTSREVHLKPFLGAWEKGQKGGPVKLLDYRGRSVLGELPAAINAEQLDRLVVSAQAEKRSKLAMVMLEDHQPALLAIYPVLYPYSQEAIGTLAGVINLSSVFRQKVSWIDRDDVGVELTHQSRVMATYPDGAGPKFFPASFELIPRENIEGGAPLLTVYSSRNPWVQPVLKRVLLSALLTVCLGVLVWRVADAFAKRMTRRLYRLAKECEAIAAGQASNITEDSSLDEIGVLSRTLRQALESYAHINTNLEGLVAEKTRQLSDSQRLLRTVIDETPDMIFMKDWDGRLLLGNKALAAFYGTTPDELVGKKRSHFAPDQAQVDSFEQNAQDIVRSGQTHVVQECLVDPRTGEKRYFQSEKMPLQGPDGEPRILVVSHDVTDLLAAHRVIEERERQYAYVMAATGEGVWDWDISLNIVRHNAKWCQLFGVDPSLLQHPVEMFVSLLHEDDRESVMTAVQLALEGKAPYVHEHRIRRPDGEIVWLLDRGQVVERGAEGQPLRMVGSVTDITARKQSEVKLRQAASVFTSSQEGIMISDAENRIVDVNPAFSRITGYEREEVLGKDLHFLGSGQETDEFYVGIQESLASTGSWQGEIWNRRKSGEVYAERLTIDVVRAENGVPLQHVAVFSDISRIKEHEEELERLAHFDALTGLPNRRLLGDRLERAIAHSRRGGKTLAVCYLDLDGFKPVNDTYGHAAGDSLLVEITSRLRRVLRGEDTLARIGGDEFVLLFGELAHLEETETVLARVLAEVNLPVQISDASVRVSASIGFTLYPDDAADAETLLCHADAALYQAKESGKNTCCRFGA